jgi:hypothetical protein
MSSNSSPKHNFLAYHTIFILNENIKWLEEYIVYYINLGFEHFYLYNNEGSIGRNGSSNTFNKYGFPCNTTSSEEDLILLNKILEKYKNYITYIVWQPKNEKGEIVYGQVESIKDCISKYGKYNEWIAFMDLDEFIFSKNNTNLVSYLKKLDKNVSTIRLIQKKFLDRFLTKEKFIIKEFGCIEGLKIGIEWAPKNIIRCSEYVSVDQIHNIKTKNKLIVPEVNVLRFNHYNVNEKQYNYIKKNYKVDIKINGKDNSMDRYKNILNNIKL